MPAVPFWDSVFKKIINRLTPFSEGGTYILQIGWFYCYKLFQHSRHFSQWLTQIFICSQVKSSERSFKAIQKVEVLVEREWNSCEIRDQHLEFILRVWRLQGAVEQRGKTTLGAQSKAGFAALGGHGGGDSSTKGCVSCSHHQRCQTERCRLSFCSLLTNPPALSFFGLHSKGSAIKKRKFNFLDLKQKGWKWSAFLKGND